MLELLDQQEAFSTQMDKVDPFRRVVVVNHLQPLVHFISTPETIPLHVLQALRTIHVMAEIAIKTNRDLPQAQLVLAVQINVQIWGLTTCPEVAVPTINPHAHNKISVSSHHFSRADKLQFNLLPIVQSTVVQMAVLVNDHRKEDQEDQAEEDPVDQYRAEADQADKVGQVEEDPQWEDKVVLEWRVVPLDRKAVDQHRIDLASKAQVEDLSKPPSRSRLQPVMDQRRLQRWEYQYRNKRANVL